MPPDILQDSSPEQRVTWPRISKVMGLKNPFLREDEEARGCNVTQPTMDFPREAKRNQEITGLLKLLFCHYSHAG